MELLKREVESSKTLPRWLINEGRLREAQMTGNKRGSAIVITVKGETEAKRLCVSGLRFGGLIRVVEKYWEAESSSVCMTCCGISHERMGDCRNWPAKCIIYTGAHKVEEHQCGVTGCTKSRGKICPHITVMCANCGGGHMANSPRCVSRQKAGIKASKEKKLRKQSEKEKEKVASKDEDDVGERDKSPQPETGMDLGAENWARSPSDEGLELDAPESQDLEAENWAKSPSKKGLELDAPKSQDYTQNY